MTNDDLDISGDGSIVLYHGKGGAVTNPKWQAGIKIRGTTGYRRQSLHTTDFAEAKVLARQLYDDISFSVRQGLTLNPKQFSKVFNEYVASVASEKGKSETGSDGVRLQRRMDSLKLYALPFFEKKRIDSIKTSDFTDFFGLQTDQLQIKTTY